MFWGWAWAWAWAWARARARARTRARARARARARCFLPNNCFFILPQYFSNTVTKLIGCKF